MDHPNLLPASRLISQSFVTSQPAFIKALFYAWILTLSHFLGGSALDLDTDNTLTSVHPQFRNALWQISTLDNGQENEARHVRTMAVTGADSGAAGIHHFAKHEPNWRASLWGNNYDQRVQINNKSDLDNRFNCFHCVHYLGEEGPADSASFSLNNAPPPEEYLAAGCFSSSTTAKVKGKGDIFMDSIEIGDLVLTREGKYQPVYSIDHRDTKKPTNFLQILLVTSLTEETISTTGEDGTNELPTSPDADDTAGFLELTRNHMVFLDGIPHPVPAVSLKVGDVIETFVGPRPITGIRRITRNGLYNPLTTDGTIVVNNGIIASTYSAFKTAPGNNNNDKWLEISGYKIIAYQDFFDAALQSYAFLCTLGVSQHFDNLLCKKTIATNRDNNGEHGNERTFVSEMAARLLHYWSLQQRDNIYKAFFGVFVLASVLLQKYICWNIAMIVFSLVRNIVVATGAVTVIIIIALLSALVLVPLLLTVAIGYCIIHRGYGFILHTTHRIKKSYKKGTGYKLDEF